MGRLRRHVRGSYPPSPAVAGKWQSGGGAAEVPGQSTQSREREPPPLAAHVFPARTPPYAVTRNAAGAARARRTAPEAITAPLKA